MVFDLYFLDVMLSIVSCACWPSAFPLWKKTRNTQFYWKYVLESFQLLSQHHTDHDDLQTVKQIPGKELLRETCLPAIDVVKRLLLHGIKC